ncbi:hypothetical protein ACQKD4_10955 [Exiguobacterium sp. NPDC077395]|uniref:hypothetical protein n=1 Tax=Exiguobacterium sp. NPDC077395 TaxID=3390563 RepID=UPI003D004EC7
MQFVLGVSFLIIVVILIKNSAVTLKSLHSASLVMKTGVFTLMAGLIIQFSGSIIGFAELLILKQIIGLLFLITFLCVVIGILSFLKNTNFSLNRKVGFFSLTVGFLSTLFINYVPVITTLIPVEFDYRIIGITFYVLFVSTLLIELYKFIFRNSLSES